jgi:hypothetical protein
LRYRASCLTGTLQTTEHDGHRRLCRQIERVILPATHEGNKFFMDDLDDLLARGKTLQNLGTDCTILHTADKILNNLKINIGFQENQTHFPQCVFNILLGHDPLATKLLEYLVKLIGKAIKHEYISIFDPHGIAF